jgi:hypothetical protein
MRALNAELDIMLAVTSAKVRLRPDADLSEKGGIREH